MDALYSADEAKLDDVRSQARWMTDAKYFKTVKISPSATMKMMMHAHSGVEKGIRNTGTPVEVMGLLLGRPDTETLNALVVTDVFPLPVEGAETRVLADDQEVLNYMIDLQESLEMTRKERFMGWYHSHPFDVEVNSHCFLSSTDVSTQLSWQRAEDTHGNPWLAIVIDPLRSLARGRPEVGAFRVYPPEYTPPPNEPPDMKVGGDEHAHVERWGSCWNRYYALEVTYFMSSLSSNVISILTKNFLWMQTLSSTPMLENENHDRFAERVNSVCEKVEAYEVHLSHGVGSIRGHSHVHSLIGGESKDDSSNLTKPTQSSCDLAIETCQGQLTQLAKKVVFATPTHTTADSSSQAEADASSAMET